MYRSIILSFILTLPCVYVTHFLKIRARRQKASRGVRHAVRVDLKINDQQTTSWFILVLAAGGGAKVKVLSYISRSVFRNISADLQEAGLTRHLTAPIKAWCYEPEGCLRAFHQFLRPPCHPPTKICSTSTRAKFMAVFVLHRRCMMLLNAGTSCGLKGTKLWLPRGLKFAQIGSFEKFILM